MLRNQRCPVGMDIPRPLGRIVVRAISDVGIEAELQVVVRIDEPGSRRYPERSRLYPMKE